MASKPAVAAPGEPVQVVITLKPNEGREIKAVMTAGSAMRYAWKTDGAKIRYELHGEEFNAAEGEYTSYFLYIGPKVDRRRIEEEKSVIDKMFNVDARILRFMR